MDYFNKITDFIQRIWFWGSVIASLFAGVNWYMEWHKYVGLLSFLIAIILITSHFFVWIRSWVKNKKKPIFVSFNDAIKIVGDCVFYDINEHRIIFENMRFTRHSYSKGLLVKRIKDKEISLHGRKIYSSKSELQKIDVKEFKRLYLEKDCNFLSSPKYCDKRENIYTDLSFNKKELELLVEKLKQELIE